VQIPDVQYARSGDVSIAYQVVGEWPTDLVFFRGTTGDLLSTWDQPLLIRHVEGLLRSCPHVGHGTGASLRGSRSAEYPWARSRRTQPGEALVSGTVKDLVAGSELEFDNRGVHGLKGVPGEWRLYAVRDS
jgi:hypothetical protein